MNGGERRKKQKNGGWVEKQKGKVLVLYIFFWLFSWNLQENHSDILLEIFFEEIFLCHWLCANVLPGYMTLRSCIQKHLEQVRQKFSPWKCFMLQPTLPMLDRVLLHNPLVRLMHATWHEDRHVNLEDCWAEDAGICTEQSSIAVNCAAVLFTFSFKFNVSVESKESPCCWIWSWYVICMELDVCIVGTVIITSSKNVGT